MDASQEVHQSAQGVIAAPSASLAVALNTFVGTFVGWPFRASPGFLVDDVGNRTDAFACVIHTTPESKDGAGGFPVDGVAAVIDASENLDLKGLRAVHVRVRAIACRSSADGDTPAAAALSCQAACSPGVTRAATMTVRRSAMSAPATGFGGRRPPRPLLRQRRGKPGVRRGAQHPFARAQCSTLRRLAHDR